LKEFNKLNLALALKNVRRCISEIVKRDGRKMLLLCILVLALIFIGIVGATVYNSMYLQSNVGVKG